MPSIRSLQPLVRERRKFWRSSGSRSVRLFLLSLTPSHKIGCQIKKGSLSLLSFNTSTLVSSTPVWLEATSDVYAVRTCWCLRSQGCHWWPQVIGIWNVNCLLVCCSSDFHSSSTSFRLFLSWRMVWCRTLWRTRSSNSVCASLGTSYMKANRSNVCSV